MLFWRRWNVEILQFCAPSFGRTMTNCWKPIQKLERRFVRKNTRYIVVCVILLTLWGLLCVSADAQVGMFYWFVMTRTHKVSTSWNFIPLWEIISCYYHVHQFISLQFMGGTVSTSQRAMMSCSWRVKTGLVLVWVAGKTVWSSCYTRAISEHSRDRA